MPYLRDGSDPTADHRTGDASIDPNAIQLSAEATALANVQTTVVSRQNPVKKVQLYGTIQVDERLSQSQTSHVSGRIEKLFVTFTGESVRRDNPSPPSTPLSC